MRNLLLVLALMLAAAISVNPGPVGSGATDSTLRTVGIEATTEVPAWMTTVCAVEDDVNCYHPDGRFTPNQGVMFVRAFPHSNRVCVMYADHPRRDYCERRR